MKETALQKMQREVAETADEYKVTMAVNLLLGLPDDGSTLVVKSKATSDVTVVMPGAPRSWRIWEAAKFLWDRRLLLVDTHGLKTDAVFAPWWIPEKALPEGETVQSRTKEHGLARLTGVVSGKDPMRFTLEGWLDFGPGGLLNVTFHVDSLPEKYSPRITEKKFTREGDLASMLVSSPDGRSHRRYNAPYRAHHLMGLDELGKLTKTKP